MQDIASMIVNKNAFKLIIDISIKEFLKFQISTFNHDLAHSILKNNYFILQFFHHRWLNCNIKEIKITFQLKFKNL